MRMAWWIWLSVISAALGIGWLLVERASAEPAEAKAAPSDQDRFWDIIERTASLEADSEAQAEALRAELSKLSQGDIEAFEATFDRFMRESYAWDLWGAAYVIHGGASDDGFEYFRAWLISKGQAVFEQARRDPDSIADMLAADSSGPLEFEEFAYVAREVWAAKSGKDPGAMPTAANMAYPTEPTGTKFEESESHLASRYPKLWKRFGHSPAQ